MADYQVIRKKVLLLLFGGLALGFSYSIHKHQRIIEAVAREWKKIDEKALWDQVRRLYRSKLVARKEKPDGTIEITLTDKGKLRALTYQFEAMEIKKGDWDNKWRIVVFDIPERLRRARDDLRDKLQELGFYELQKSVFVFPFECRDEIDFVIEFFDLRKYVRIGVLESIDNELHLKKIFKLI